MLQVKSPHIRRTGVRPSDQLQDVVHQETVLGDSKRQDFASVCHKISFNQVEFRICRYQRIEVNPGDRPFSQTEAPDA